MYLKHLGDLAYADGLPRDTIMLRRLVAVPNVLLNGNAYGALDSRLATHHAFSGIEGGEALRQFFVLKLVEDLVAGAGRACPSTKTPVPAGRGWVIVGRNLTFDWRLPILNEPVWAGHHYVLELTREPITRDGAQGGRDEHDRDGASATRRWHGWNATTSCAAHGRLCNSEIYNLKL